VTEMAFRLRNSGNPDRLSLRWYAKSGVNSKLWESKALKMQEGGI